MLPVYIRKGIHFEQMILLIDIAWLLRKRNKIILLLECILSNAKLQQRKRKSGIYLHQIKRRNLT